MMTSADITPGRRLYRSDHEADPQPGDYWPTTNTEFPGCWTVVAPNGSWGMLIPEIHTIVEHDDGTISVTPSLDIPGWHGSLEYGVWREA